jgi:hypothetical protein
LDQRTATGSSWSVDSPDGIGWAVSRGKVQIDRVLDAEFAGYRLDTRQPDGAP